MIDDPAGLLKRVAELEPLCLADEQIRRSVESGDPFKVYRTLLKARLFNRLPEHRQTIDLLVSNRRLFAKPLKGSLGLGRVNGFGATLLGKSEPQSDGTYIATHCIVALFVVPLFPLGAYVVSPGKSSGFSQGWTVYARVPLGSVAWLGSRLVALGVAASIALGTIWAVWASGHHDVHVVNGFDVPILATIGSRSVTVPAGGRVRVNVPTGTHALKAVTATDGTEVETRTENVVGGRTLIVWNIAGAAPVFDTQVEYYARSAPPSEPEPQEKLHCGEPFEVFHYVDVAFTAPPRSVSVPEHSPKATRHLVDLYKPPSDISPTRMCEFILGGQNKDRERLAIIEAGARISHWESDEAAFAIGNARIVSPDDAMRLARLAREAHPEDLGILRAYQSAFLAAGRGKEILEEFRARAAAAPDSAQAQYLLLRIVPAPEDLELSERLVAQFPSDPDILRVSIHVLAREGRWKELEAAWRSLRRISPAKSEDSLELAAASFVAQGRKDELLEMLESSFEEYGPAGRRNAALVYALVSAGYGGRQPDLLIRRIEGAVPDSPPSAILRAAAGLPPVEGEKRIGAAEVLDLAPRDPVAALERVAALGASQVQQIEQRTWALLFAEAIRTGSSEARASLARVSPLAGDDLAHFERFVQGEPGVAAQLIDLDLRPGACVVRSRNASLSASERQKLIADARRDDVLRSSVTKAIAGWKPASRGP